MENAEENDTEDKRMTIQTKSVWCMRISRVV